MAARGYRPEFDGLRGIAVALVVVHHAWPTSGFAGYVGVDVFFALSGYLITTLLLAERPTLQRFYVRRLLRLYPALIALVVCLVPFSHAVWVALLYVGNVLVTHHHDLGPVEHTWSLAQEEQFYLVWPLCLGVAVRHRWPARTLCLALVAVACASALFYMVTSAPGNYDPRGRLTGLALGAALAVAAHAGWQGSGLRVGSSGVVGLAAVVTVGTLNPAAIAWTVPAASVAATLVLAHLARGVGPLVAALRWKPLVRLGVLSYSLYLWHYPLLYTLHAQLGWGVATAAAVGVPVSLVAAAVSYRWIERPVLQWRDRRFSSEHVKVSGVVCSEAAGHIDVPTQLSGASSSNRHGQRWAGTPRVGRWVIDLDRRLVRRASSVAGDHVDLTVEDGAGRVSAGGRH